MYEEANKSIDKIIWVNDWLAEFWSNSHGWAPTEAAELMSKSRLDYHVSLSHTLKIWMEDISEDELCGCLILAWSNLGALVEGTMKLFLCVFYNDYQNDLINHSN